MNDVVNGLFEFVGGILIWLSVARVLRDRQVAGISLVPTAFFTAWDLWNLYFYPSVGVLVVVRGRGLPGSGQRCLAGAGAEVPSEDSLQGEGNLWQ